jgi:hypothetical protein
MQLRRAVLSTDAHPDYYPFWATVARAWSTIVGVVPTLAVIGDGAFGLDEHAGEVRRFAPIPGVPTSLHAQAIRLLLPALFPEDACILADVDLIPLNAAYFHRAVRDLPDDAFVVFRDAAYDLAEGRYPMCFNAARGSTFAEIFGVRGEADFELRLREWAALELGWHTDESVLRQEVDRWGAEPGHSVVRLGHTVTGRVDRSRWRHSAAGCRAGLYVDAHLPRPYHEHTRTIDRLVAHAARHRASPAVERWIGPMVRCGVEWSRRGRAVAVALLTKRGRAVAGALLRRA